MDSTYEYVEADTTSADTTRAPSLPPPEAAAHGGAEASLDTTVSVAVTPPAESSIVAGAGDSSLAVRDSLAKAASDTLAGAAPDTLAARPDSAVTVAGTGSPPPGTVYGPPLPPDFRLRRSGLLRRGSTGFIRIKPGDGAFLDMAVPQPERIPALLESPRVFPQEAILNVNPPRELSTTATYDASSHVLTRANLYNGVPVQLPHAQDMHSYARDEFTYGLRRAWRQYAAGQTPTFSGTLNRPNGLKVQFDTPKTLAGIFGTGANLSVNGSEQVTIGGVSDYSPNIQGIVRQSAFPSLTMKQDLQVNLGGSIGDKIRVDVDQKSNVQSDLENRIHIDYTGYKDEIVRSLNLGNTNLQIPGQFVSYGGQQQGLFGIRTEAALGGMQLQMVASKEQAKSGHASFTPDKKQSPRLDDDQFILGRFFFLSDPSRASEKIDLSTLEVYLDDRNNTNNTTSEGGTVPGRAYLVADDYSDPDTLNLTGNFNLLRVNVDYYVDQFYVGYPIVVLNDALSGSRVQSLLAVRYNVTLADQTTRPVPGTTERAIGDTILLKALRVPFDAREDITDLRVGPWGPTRLLEARMFYDLGTNTIDPKSTTFKLTIKRDAAGVPREDLNGRSYLELLGLDQENDQGGSTPDGRVDERWIDTVHGYLRFPRLEPFADTTALGGDVDTLFYIRSWESRPTDFSPKYYIETEGAGVQTRIELGRFDVRENSETLLLDGVKLTRGTDYEIDYQTGVIELKSERARRSNGQITVDYAYNPLFSLSQNTIMGATSRFRIGGKEGTQGHDISATVLYEGRGGVSSIEHPRLGESPGRTLVGDVTGNFAFQPEIMSKMIDALPFVRSGASTSTLTLNGEVGASVPNPNTRNVAYLDDMEGIKDITSSLTDYRRWVWSSIPFTLDSARTDVYADQAAMRWYNLPPESTLLVRDVYPDLVPSLSETERTNRVPALIWRVDPNQSAAAARGRVDQSWAGLTQLLSQQGEDLERAQYLDLFLRVADSLAIPKGRANDADLADLTLHVEFGTVSEDAEWQHGVRPNGLLDTEDKNRDGQLDANTEDTGLDTLFSAQEIEQGIPPGPDGTAQDPSGDDYVYNASRETSNDFTHINGTERNLGAPDTEDLNVDGILDPSDKYFEFAIKLADPDTSLYKPANENGFRQYQIPLDRAIAHRSAGASKPAWSQIKHVRMWIEGAPYPLTLEIVRLDIVGNRWLGVPVPSDLQALGQRIDVLVADTKQNTGTPYEPPPGTVQRDPTVTGTGYLPERSLLLSFGDVQPGTSVAAFRIGSEESYALYDSVEMWVRVPEKRPEQSVTFFFRLGADTTNYYEYRKKIEGSEWVPLFIPLADLTQSKANPDGLDTLGTFGGIIRRRFRLVNGDTTYIAVGEPSLTKVKRLEVGITNTSAFPDSGTLLVDEIRLGHVQKERGFARRLDMNAVFSDLGNVSVNYLNKDANFLSIGNTQGSGTTNRQLNVSTSMNVDRFLPNWGFRVPLSATWNSTTGIPKFVPGSDVRYDAGLSRRGISEYGTRSVSISMSRAPSRTPITRYTIDAITWNASMQDSRNRSTTQLDSSRVITGSATYRLSAVPPKGGGQGQILLPPIPIGRVLGAAFPRLRTSTLRLLPTAVTFSVTASSRNGVLRSRDADADTLGPIRPSYSKVARLGADFQFSPFDDLPRLSVGMGSDRDLTQLDGRSIPILGNSGREISGSRSFAVSFDPGWLNFLNMRTEFTTGSNVDQRPALRTISDSLVDRVVGVSNQQGFSISGAIPLQVLFGPVSPRRQNQAPAPAPATDSSGAKPKAPGVSPFTRVRMALADVITFTTLNVRHTDDRSSSYSRVNGVPGAAYRFGFTRSLPFDLDLLDGARVTTSERRRDQLSTTATLLKILRVETRYGRDTDNSLSDGLGYPRRATTWPDVSGSLTGLDRRFGLNKTFTSLSVDAAYQRQATLVFKANGLDKQSDAITSRWTPLFRVRATWRSGLTSTVSSERSSTSQLNTFTESGEQRSVQRDLTHSVDLTKTFDTSRGMKLPFMKKIALKSPLGTGLTFTWRQSLNQSEATGQPPVTQDKRHSWTVSTHADYAVGRDVNSSFRLLTSRSYNDKTTIENRRVEVNLTLTYLFQ